MKDGVEVGRIGQHVLKVVPAEQNIQDQCASDYDMQAMAYESEANSGYSMKSGLFSIASSWEVEFQVAEVRASHASLCFDSNPT